ncbi:hypothetical protein KKG72_09455 [bacterium]|nr:hypothetical protein [bacterium]MBU1993110.1 hypothetical protein [bacterium]
MKRIQPYSPLFYFLVLFVFLESAHAIPAFSRQTGLECMMCHAGNQTKLNSFGRQFAHSAYTMSTKSGPQSLLVGDDVGLSLPSVLNMSLMLKARFDKGYDVVNGNGDVLEAKNGDYLSNNRGVYEIFKTSTINLAGRVADNIGTVIEFREKEGKAIIGGKVAASYEMGQGYAGLSIFSTNNYGPFTGMETYNTGLYKPLRQFENHKLTNAAQAADLASGAATGLQVFYSGENLFATLGAYVPIHNSDGIDIGKYLIPFARLAYEQPIGNLRLIIGAYGINGSAKASNTVYEPSLSGLVPQVLVKTKKEAYGIDLQLEGEVLSMDTILTINAVLKNNTTLDRPSMMNYISTINPQDSIYGDPADSAMEASSLELEMYPIDSLGIKIAFMSVDDKGPHTYQPDKIDVKDKNAYTLGFDYSFRQNIMLTMEGSMVQPKKQDIKDYADILTVLTISF